MFLWLGLVVAVLFVYHVFSDGDFSFSAGLVRHRKGKGAGLTLTSFDSAAEVAQKYKTAKANLAAVNAAGATVLHGVDATRLGRSFPVAAGDGHRFDRIVFNFPHSGQQRVHVNRTHASHVLVEEGRLSLAFSS